MISEFDVGEYRHGHNQMNLRHAMNVDMVEVKIKRGNIAVPADAYRANGFMFIKGDSHLRSVNSNANYLTQYIMP